MLCPALRCNVSSPDPKRVDVAYVFFEKSFGSYISSFCARVNLAMTLKVCFDESVEEDDDSYRTNHFANFCFSYDFDFFFQT